METHRRKRNAPTRVKRAVLAILVLLPPAALAITLPPDSDFFGWRPLFELFGKGDPDVAFVEMERDLTVIEKLAGAFSYDEYADRLYRDARKLLIEFDMKPFHEALPDTDGDNRWLTLFGRENGVGYKLTRAAQGGMQGVPLDAPGRELGDFAALLRAKPLGPAAGGGELYRLAGRMGLVIGNVDWESLVEASKASMETVELFPQEMLAAGGGRGSVAPDNSRKSARTAALMLEGALSVSFPALARIVGNIGTIDELRITSEGPGVRRVITKLHLTPDKLPARYTPVADYLRSLGKVITLSSRWRDSKGRLLGRQRLDTDTLSLEAETVVKDGLPVPWDERGVYPGDTADPMGAALDNTTVETDIELRVYGLTLRLDGIRNRVTYDHTPRAAHITSTATEMPEISFSGRALGFLPPSFVDFFIPGNLEAITRRFMKASIEGNDGKGVINELRFGRFNAGRQAIMEGMHKQDVLSNFFVRFWIHVVNRKFFPEEDQLDNMLVLLKDVVKAMRSDLDSVRARHARLASKTE